MLVICKNKSIIRNSIASGRVALDLESFYIFFSLPLLVDSGYYFGNTLRIFYCWLQVLMAQMKLFTVHVIMRMF